MLRLALLLSGQGSNAIAIHRAIEAGRIPATIELVLSSNPHAAGLHYFQKETTLKTIALARGNGESKDDYSQKLVNALQARTPPLLIVMAGFMHIIGTPLLAAYPNRILNIHPSLLPRHKGLHTHQRVLACGDRLHGSTVHVVTEALDGGPLLAQTQFPITGSLNQEQLEQQVKQAEWQLYPRVLALIAHGKLALPASDNLPLAKNSPHQVKYRNDQSHLPYRYSFATDTTAG